MVENLMKSPMDQLLRDDFYSGLGAWHTTYNPLKRMDTLQIVPTEQDGFVRRQLLCGYVHDERPLFKGVFLETLDYFRTRMIWRRCSN